MTASCISSTLFIELIDTWWDVNNQREEIKAWRDEELIDTQWDVNLLGIYWDRLKALELIDT